ncbi:MAG TPA: AraC family transcriptional regulator ligand-binding domain-containing protein [Candidatus Sulfopaludibacter sp.]|nr:AraC family transcriptional regulator ligand-binding domain-containing protein [Candidatus Sulfopaludibacter sp.]
MTDRFRVSSLLAQRLAEHQLPLSALLQRAGLPPGFFQQEKIYATTTELFALWRTIGEMSADPAFGLKFGAEPRLERYQPTAIAAVCSRSFRDALQRMARYKQLTCPEEIRVHAKGEETTVEFSYVEAKEIQPDVLVDVCLAWIASLARRGTDGRVTPLRVDLARASQHRELLENHYGCRVRFKAGRNALVYRSRDLDRPFVTHNAELLALTGAQLETELQEWKAGADVAEQVKHTLKRSLAGRRPTLQQVARELGTSTRSLQRRLTEVHITFQQLVEDTRRELARHYLKHSAVELNEAAYLLGYEDANSFFRAFHLWEGASPGEWRTRHGTAAVAT